VSGRTQKLSSQKVRQLGYVRRDAPRLVAGDKKASRKRYGGAGSRLPLASFA